MRKNRIGKEEGNIEQVSCSLAYQHFLSIQQLPYVHGIKKRNSTRRRHVYVEEATI